jgi:hypothetical protein
MPRTRLLPVVAALVLAAVPAVATASTSHAKFWQPASRQIGCGIEIHAPSQPGNTLICSARGIPAPSSGPTDGDPGFVTLKASGAPVRIRTSQDSFEGTTPTTLPSGSTWSSIGITCKLTASSVRCTNRSGHGFKITTHGYTAF